MLEAENTELRLENAELRSRLSQNSNNSHQPPSSDGLKKKIAFSQPQGKKTGGQIGRQDKTLSIVSNPDHILVHHAPCCECCSKVFTVADVSSILKKRQVFDIPAPRLEVIEHQIGIVTCCGHVYKGSFPSMVN